MKITLSPIEIDGPLLVSYPRFTDERGVFAEVYSSVDFKDAGIPADFVQDNISLTLKRGTLRGLHFQKPPFAQDKLVRVHRGKIFDVIVDLRSQSRSFGMSFCCTLDSRDDTMLFVPKGFAHGFCSLEDNTEVFYKVSAPYNAECDAGVFWADPDLGICWPDFVDKGSPSQKDRNLPLFKNLPQGLF